MLRSSAIVTTMVLVCGSLAAGTFIGCSGGSASLFYQHESPQALQRDTLGTDGRIVSTIAWPEHEANGIIKIVPVDQLERTEEVPITVPAAATESLGDRFAERTLNVPAGFSAEIIAWDVGKPHDIVVGPSGTLFVSDIEGGRIVAVAPDGAVTTIASGLSDPSGMTIGGNALFYATETKLFRYDIPSGNPTSGTAKLLTDRLPSGGDFYTRAIVYRDRDKKVYVSIGVTDRIDVERDREHGTIFAVSAEGGAPKRVFLSGLRNNAGIDVHPETGDLWGVDQGLDDLAESLAPDEVNILKSGGEYGNPFYYSQNLENPKFVETKTASRPKKPTPSLIDLEPYSGASDAHFYSGSVFGEEMRNALFIVYNGYEVGAVRRADDLKTGAKVVRINVAADGSNPMQADLFSGWLTDGDYWGRPVAIAWSQDGADFFVTDEKNRVIYRFRRP